MNSITVRPEFYSRLKQLAERRHISVQSFVETSLADRVAQIEEWERLKARLPKPSREIFDRVLAKVPDRAPMKGDEWPPKKTATRRAAPKGRRVPAKRTRRVAA
jgi:hypothetical protein